jgi:superoxide dismutase, Fe-Mn family
MKKNSRRDFIKAGTAITVGAAVLNLNPLQTLASVNQIPFALPSLQYAYNALEPYIDEQTMTIHHTKHHQAYINNLNTAILKISDKGSITLEDLLKNITRLPDDIRTAVRNNGGGHWNHDFFWKMLTPKTDTKPHAQLQKAIDKYFTSADGFKENFSKSAMSIFGSGWAWLIVTPSKELKIISTPNQDNPLMDVVAENGMPVLGIDVWEHAYYLKHQNKRADYVKDFLNVVNWHFVNEEFDKAMK